MSLQYDPQLQRVDGKLSLPNGQPQALWLTLRLPQGKRWQKLQVGDQQLLPQGPAGDRFNLKGLSGNVSLQAFLA
ncbi:hypothetical protein KHX94_11000 [Shewanella dokdonensis]|uniref:Uncharacterized protein n=1 Tax=Shewanella dokdonensis TaxID=712036 RepID=A0ABX8DCN0_9GAMM|nr:hypothetical protein [Shewanella dokdonensis]QVK22011.1 hypothetical protein KHX94_11000 [Shewanella dokdonensis]